MVATTGTAESTSPHAILPAAVEVRDLSRHFGSKAALDRVTLKVPTGSVLGLVGENGAGKTTLIRHVLGLLRAQCGTVRVFGLDPVADPVPVLSRIGYLSEEPDMPGWMRIHQLMRYVAGFYPTWDAAYAEKLRRDFALDPMKRVKDLSKGQRARAGLVTALAYRPDLLVLDEPSSGLDPIVRRDILGAISGITNAPATLANKMARVRSQSAYTIDEAGDWEFIPPPNSEGFHRHAPRKFHPA
ncbi:MAG TPA: ABC transporter ATP-binding protein [Tepidisphaeraceae bacterium]